MPNCFYHVSLDGFGKWYAITLYGTARGLRDCRSCQFPDWYLAWQTEEEKNARDLLAKYDISGGDARGIFLLDEFLGRRNSKPISAWSSQKTPLRRPAPLGAAFFMLPCSCRSWSAASRPR